MSVPSISRTKVFGCAVLGPLLAGTSPLFDTEGFQRKGIFWKDRIRISAVVLASDKPAIGRFEVNRKGYLPHPN